MFFKLLLTAVCFLFLSCATLSGKYERRDDWPVYEIPDDASVIETKLENGCDYVKVIDAEFPLIFHLVKIPLENFSVLTCMPEKIYEDGFVKAQKTKKFSRRTDSYIAINTSPYSFYKGLNPIKRKDLRRISGVYRENNITFSEPVAKYASVAFYKNHSARIYFSQTDEVEEASAEESAVLTVGGFFPLVKEGKKTGKYIDNKEQQTALGISKDGKTVFILVVEGTDFEKSRGLNYSETSDILIHYGVWNALMFDGGHSTALCIDKKNVLSSAFQRKVPLSLGFIK